MFKLPRDNSTDFIKRVIGLPGDEIEVRGGVLYINGQAVPQGAQGRLRLAGGGGRRAIPALSRRRCPTASSTTVLDSEPERPFDNVGPYKVPAGHYFMMGDNRDNSTDSRAQSPRYGVGYVPFENLVGRAEIIFFSAAVDDPDAFRLTSPWTWPFDIRWGRFFNLVR